MESAAAFLQFTVHVFVNHDPVLAHALLPQLFFDFEDSAWKLDPLVEQPPRPRERPGNRPRRQEKARDALGRYVLPEPVSGDTTLLQLSEKMEQEFGMAKKYQAQFTIFPQMLMDEGQYPTWHNRPLPWDMTVAVVCLLDHDLADGGDGSARDTTNSGTNVLHLVLDTKSAALSRILGTLFLDSELGEPYGLLRDQWNQFDSYWHSQVWNQRYSQLESSLLAWRTATFAHAYLTKQREKGRAGPHNDELTTSLRRVGDIQEITRQGGLPEMQKWEMEAELWHLLRRIRQIESNEANGQKESRELSWFVTQWEDWFGNRDFENFAIRILESAEVESKVASVIRHSLQVIDEWSSSESLQQLKSSIDEEYYTTRPWLTVEDRASTERRILERLEFAAPHPREIVSEDTSTSTDDYLVPSPQIQAHRVRGPDGKLLPEQSTFTVSSGSILWGQMIGLYSTMSNSTFTQNADHMPPPLEGGTILQHHYSYRSAARNGRWKVRPYHERVRIGRGSGVLIADPDAPGLQTGWIVYHEDVDPVNTLGRVRSLDGTGPGAVSNRNLHTDKDIVYIGRYDWSYHSRGILLPEFQQWAEPVIGLVSDTRDSDQPPKCNVRIGGYLLAIDEAYFGLDFVAAYKRDCDRGFNNLDDPNHTEPTIEKVLRKDGANFGTFLSLANTEEEFGWLVFSGEQHPDHGVDELVAIVYSSSMMENAYLFPEGDPSPI